MLLREGLGNTVFFGSYELCKQVRNASIVLPQAFSFVRLVPQGSGGGDGSSVRRFVFCVPLSFSVATYVWQGCVVGWSAFCEASRRFSIHNNKQQ